MPHLQERRCERYRIAFGICILLSLCILARRKAWGLSCNFITSTNMANEKSHDLVAYDSMYICLGHPRMHVSI
jgi:hypothetical protein